MKIAIITAMWKRPEVFDLFGMNTNVLISQVKGYEIQVFVAGSEGRRSKRLADEYGFNYVEYPNEQLYSKFNAAVRLAKKWRPDYLLMMGSDDIIDLPMFENYIKPMQKGIDFIGCLDWCFLDINTMKACMWLGYTERGRKGITCGAGRMLSSKLLAKMDWRPWDKPVNGARMDGTMQKKLKSIQHTSYCFRMGSGVGLDIKSETNITNIKKIRNTKPISVDFLRNRFMLP